MLKQRLHQFARRQWRESNDSFGSEHLGLSVHLLDLCVFDFLREAILQIWYGNFLTSSVALCFLSLVHQLLEHVASTMQTAFVFFIGLAATFE